MKSSVDIMLGRRLSVYLSIMVLIAPFQLSTNIYRLKSATIRAQTAGVLWKYPGIAENRTGATPRLLPVVKVAFMVEIDFVNANFVKLRARLAGIKSPKLRRQ
ncbi:MAG: hypothetical protein ABL884_12295 [Methyloglobulus sp.]